MSGKGVPGSPGDIGLTGNRGTKGARGRSGIRGVNGKDGPPGKIMLHDQFILMQPMQVYLVLQEEQEVLDRVVILVYQGLLGYRVLLGYLDHLTAKGSLREILNT